MLIQSVFDNLNYDIVFSVEHCFQTIDMFYVNESLNLVKQVDLNDGQQVRCRVFLKEENRGPGIDPFVNIGFEKTLLEKLNVKELIL